MANHNYSQYSNNKKHGGKKNPTIEVESNVEDVVETPVEVVTPEVKMEAAPVVETVETKEVPKTTIGIVSNCAKLNVRNKPALTADVVTVINVDETVSIDATKSNRDWFYVSVDNGGYGYNGYCMKKFVTAKL